MFLISGSNGTATKDLLPPPSASGSVIKDSKDKDKKEDKSKDAEKDKDKDKKEGKDVANSSISSTASTTSAKFTTSNFVETVSCVHEYSASFIQLFNTAKTIRDPILQFYYLVNSFCNFSKTSVLQ